MSLFIIKCTQHKKLYYRFLRANDYLIYTGVKERAACFNDMSAAQEVCDELDIAGHRSFVVAAFEDE